jgi:hypothetical protein
MEILKNSRCPLWITTGEENEKSNQQISWGAGDNVSPILIYLLIVWARRSSSFIPAERSRSCFGTDWKIGWPRSVPRPLG